MNNDSLKHTIVRKLLGPPNGRRCPGHLHGTSSSNPAGLHGLPLSSSWQFAAQTINVLKKTYKFHLSLASLLNRKRAKKREQKCSCNMHKQIITYQMFEIPYDHLKIYCRLSADPPPCFQNKAAFPTSVGTAPIAAGKSSFARTAEAHATFFQLADSLGKTGLKQRLNMQRWRLPRRFEQSWWRREPCAQLRLSTPTRPARSLGCFDPAPHGGCSSSSKARQLAGLHTLHRAVKAIGPTSSLPVFHPKQAHPGVKWSRAEQQWKAQQRVQGRNLTFRSRRKNHSETWSSRSRRLWPG